MICIQTTLKKEIKINSAIIITNYKKQASKMHYSNTVSEHLIFIP